MNEIEVKLKKMIYSKKDRKLIMETIEDLLKQAFEAGREEIYKGYNEWKYSYDDWKQWYDEWNNMQEEIK